MSSKTYNKKTRCCIIRSMRWSGRWTRCNSSGRSYLLRTSGLRSIYVLVISSPIERAIISWWTALPSLPEVIWMRYQHTKMGAELVGAKRIYVLGGTSRSINYLAVKASRGTWSAPLSSSRWRKTNRKASEKSKTSGGRSQMSLGLVATTRWGKLIAIVLECTTWPAWITAAIGEITTSQVSRRSAITSRWIYQEMETKPLERE